MKKKLLLTAVFLLMFFVIVACTPDGAEPENTDRISSRTPLPQTTSYPDPTALPPPTLTAVSVDLPLDPDEVPAMLPIYTKVLEPVPQNGEAALDWAQSFGLIDGEIVEENDGLIRVLSLDDSGNFYEELTFIKHPNESSIFYSSGIYWQNFSGPTPTPEIELRLQLPSEMITRIAREFVLEHNLLSEPIIAHELPAFNDTYTVHVGPILSGMRLAEVNQESGITVRINGQGDVVGAFFIPASYVPIETVPIQPFSQIYPVPINHNSPDGILNHRSNSDLLPLDPMRFQVHSLPYGDQRDRVELVYLTQPNNLERAVPMWLITRPHEESWNFYDEYYVSASMSENVPRPRPTPTPLAVSGIVPQSLKILPPLLVEQADGRLFTNAVVDGITHTVSLNAETGDLLAVYGLTGGLALDDGRNQLFVDKHPDGLTVIDTDTGQVLNEIQIPEGGRSLAQIQADPVTGHVLLFRDQMVLVADPLSESWQQSVPVTVEGTVCDEPMEAPPVIEQTWIDPEARLLYMTLIDYVCTPWISYSMVIYNLDTMGEVARYPALDYLSGVAANGRFYGKSWFRMGRSFQWAWQNGQPWLELHERGADQSASLAGFQADKNRGWLYEMTRNGLQVLDMETMAVIKVIPVPVNGQLVGIDLVTDNLYFVEEESGRLVVWLAENIQN